MFYLAVWPLGGSPNAESFFANYVSVILILVLYIGAKIYYRGRRWVDISTVDLDYGRRFYVDREDKETGAKKGPAARAAKKTLSVLFN
jgi:amino acid transporter